MILNADYTLHTTLDMFLVLFANFPHYLVVVHKHYYLKLTLVIAGCSVLSADTSAAVAEVMEGC